MTDHQKLLTALLAEDAPRLDGDVSVFDVMTMLYVLGEEHRQPMDRQLVPVSA